MRATKIKKRVYSWRLVPKLISALLISTFCHSYSLAQQVISTQGGEFIKETGSINFTIGEIVILTLSNSELTLTQGFQQPTLILENNDAMVDVIKNSLTQAITPNGDGKNDEFIIKGIEEFPNNLVRIFDRWGSLIYEVKGYNNADKVWKGQSTRGLISSGMTTSSTYFYTIQLGPNMKSISGFIHFKL